MPRRSSSAHSPCILELLSLPALSPLRQKQYPSRVCWGRPSPDIRPFSQNFLPTPSPLHSQILGHTILRSFEPALASISKLRLSPSHSTVSSHILGDCYRKAPHAQLTVKGYVGSPSAKGLSHRRTRAATAFPTPLHPQARPRSDQVANTVLGSSDTPYKGSSPPNLWSTSGSGPALWQPHHHTTSLTAVTSLQPRSRR